MRCTADLESVLRVVLRHLGDEHVLPRCHVGSPMLFAAEHRRARMKRRAVRDAPCGQVYSMRLVCTRTTDDCGGQSDRRADHSMERAVDAARNAAAPALRTIGLLRLCEDRVSRSGGAPNQTTARSDRSIASNERCSFGGTEGTARTWSERWARRRIRRKRMARFSAF